MFAIIKEMWDDGWPGKTMLIVAALCIAMIPLIVYAAMEEAKAWGKFKEEHACKLVGQTTGTTQTGVGLGMLANGQMGTVIMTTNTPGKTGWLCDDGVTYWR